MMANELQSLNERIAEKVGKELIDLIPEEQWLKLVSDQTEFFMKNKAPGIIEKELALLLKAAVAEKLMTIEYAQDWDALTGEMVSTTLKEFLEKSSSTIFAAMLAPIMSGFLQDLRSRLGQGF